MQTVLSDYRKMPLPQQTRKSRKRHNARTIFAFHCPIMLTIYHNTRCSKSRGALEIATQFAERHGIDLHIIDYQKTPLTHTQLKELHQLLQSVGPVQVRDMVRDNEPAFDELHLAHADDNALLDALVAHPVLLQRPILRFNDRAIIARPPELAEKILRT